MRSATLIGVGVGPGDPELVTVKAVRVLREADLVLVPVAGSGERGRAEATVLAHVSHDRIRRVSTFTYLAATVRERVPGLEVATVPGITAMQDLAARSGTVLCEGNETLALLPLTAGIECFGQALATFDTVVGYKSGRHLPEVLAAVRDAGRLGEAVHGAALGLPGEDIRPAAEVSGPAPYLSTLLVPGRRTHRGGKL